VVSKNPSRLWIGTRRRQQWPVRPRKLQGCSRKPIVTRSVSPGCRLFLGEDDRIYRVGGAPVTPSLPRCYWAH